MQFKGYYVREFYSHRVRKCKYAQRHNPEGRSSHHITGLYYLSKGEVQQFKNLPLPKVPHQIKSVSLPLWNIVNSCYGCCIIVNVCVLEPHYLAKI